MLNIKYWTFNVYLYVKQFILYLWYSINIIKSKTKDFLI